MLHVPDLVIVPEMESPASPSTAWRTDPGLVRRHNEDFVAVYEPATAEDLERHGRLYIVADGVGGADAGEVASRYASERTLHHYLSATEAESPGLRLLEAMQAANTDLRRLASGRDDSRRMATTMVAAVVVDDRAYIGNVGDSRAYLLHNDDLAQITQDQSLVAQLLQEGALTPEEAARYPYKNIILYSIGSEKRPPIDLYEVALGPGDFLLLCSDGLTRHVDDHEIRELISRESPREATESLVSLARERGGEDNITVAVVRHGPPDEGAALAAASALAERSHSAATTVAVAGAQPERSLWPFTIFLTLVMIALIILLWIVIQRATML